MQKSAQLLLSKHISQPTLTPCLSIPVTLCWPVNVVDRHVVTVNTRYWSRFYASAVKHPLSHIMSQAFNRSVSAEAPERFAVVRDHINRRAYSLQCWIQTETSPVSMNRPILLWW